MDFNNFSILKTYCYHDEPLIFSTQISNKLFLAYSWKVSEEGHTFIFFETTPDLLVKLEEDKITIRDFFRSTMEKRIAYKIRYKNRKLLALSEISLSEMEKEAYPKEGTFLEADE